MHFTVLKAQHLSAVGMVDGISRDPAGGGEGIRAGGGASPNYLTVINSTKIIFAANDGINGTELWESDGTTAGTVLAADHNPGSSSSGPKPFPTMGASLCLMRANNYNGWSTELHSYQANTTPGTPGVMTAIADVNQQLSQIQDSAHVASHDSAQHHKHLRAQEQELLHSLEQILDRQHQSSAQQASLALCRELQALNRP